VTIRQDALKAVKEEEIGWVPAIDYLIGGSYHPRKSKDSKVQVPGQDI
jgi:hypothetical protein